VPILGSSAGAAKGAPGVPTVGTATVTDSTTVSLAFTAPSFSKLPITSYTVTSSPSIALSTSGTSSPLTVTGTFASSTAYTFTIVANNANGSSAASAASNSVTPISSYTLVAQANASTNYVVGAYNQIAVYMWGGSGASSAGEAGSNNYGGAGGTGGASSAGLCFYDYAVTPGETLGLTIGGPSFGTSELSRAGTVIASIGAVYTGAGPTNTAVGNSKTGGAGAARTNANNSAGSTGGAGSAGDILTMNASGLGSVQLGGSGGGGGSGGKSTSGTTIRGGGSGGAGGNPEGTQGGTGGTGQYSLGEINSGDQAAPIPNSNRGSAPGGGGGGGSIQGVGGANGAGGRNGSSGRIIIYAR
jgi:hypothetical protein